MRDACTGRLPNNSHLVSVRDVKDIRHVHDGLVRARHDVHAEKLVRRALLAKRYILPFVLLKGCLGQAAGRMT